MKPKTCDWLPSACDRPRNGVSTYCAEHAEEARRNVIRSLGLDAMKSLMWRDGDEKWLFGDFKPFQSNGGREPK